MGGITDNRIDWVFPTTPEDDKVVEPSTERRAQLELERQKKMADNLLEGAPTLSVDTPGFDPYNSVGRRLSK